MSKYSPQGETRKRYTIGVRSVVEKPLAVRALACRTTVEHIIEEIVECWVANERGRERAKSESLREGGEDVIEENSSESGEEYSISTERRTTDTAE